ncbi:MAG: hypothetical protein ABMA01_24315 [Chthoniobacteraceae bacterium]
MVCDCLRGWSPPSVEEILRDGISAWHRISPIDEQAHVDGDEQMDASRAVLGDVGPLLVAEPLGGYVLLFNCTVEEYLDPPCDADFEYFNEDSDG